MRRKRTPSFKIATVAHLGGIATRKALTPAQRSEAARKAVTARWKQTTKQQRQEAARKAVRARWAKVNAKQSAE